MQIFKRLIFNTKPAQNLVEVAYIIPILVFFTLIMLEVGLFWKDLNAIYSLNAEINANIANLDYTKMTLGAGVCPAVDAANTKSAVSILNLKGSRISLSDNSYTLTPVEGKAPFAMYKYSTGDISVIQKGSGSTDVETTVTKPQITLWVDCRNPFEDGVTTQIEFFHKTLFMKARMPRFDGGQGYVIIPDHWFIASPKLNTIRQY